MTEPSRARAYDGETFVVPDDGYARPEESLSPRRCAVLILTATAADAVRQLMASARAAAEPHAGVRISAAKARAADTSVDITLVDEPETTDRTVEEAGARVFVDEGTVEFLQDKVLDAAVDARGVRFTILAQRSGARGKGEWAT